MRNIVIEETETRRIEIAINGNGIAKYVISKDETVPKIRREGMEYRFSEEIIERTYYGKKALAALFC